MIKKPDILFDDIRQILHQARQKAYSAVNFTIVEAYWKVGKRIVEEEQHGKARAEYGKQMIMELSAKLAAEFGLGCSPQSLRNMRQFYQIFKKCSALQSKSKPAGEKEIIRQGEKSYTVRSQFTI